MMNLFLKKIARLVLLGIDSAVVLFGSRNVTSSVALIRLDNIGDFILWLDSAKEYRSIYPNHKITLIANSAWSDFALHFNYWDEIWPLNTRAFRRNPLYRWSFLRRMRQAGFETAIHPSYSRVMMIGDSVIRASAARQRIGSVGDKANIYQQGKISSNRWYTQLLPANQRLTMELDRNAEFISQLAGIQFYADLPCIPILQTLPESIHLNTDYFILFPGAYWSGRQWPIEAFVELLKELQSQFDWQAVLCGSQTESKLCETILSASNSNACVNLAGCTTLAELTEIIRGARLLVGNETSAVHIATAVSTPSVCILGGGHFGRFMPYPAALPGIKPVVATYNMPCYYCNWECTQPFSLGGPVPCVRQVTVATVMQCAQEALAQRIEQLNFS